MKGKKEVIYSVELTDEKFKELWVQFKKWKGSQRDFYMNFVNILGLRK